MTRGKQKLHSNLIASSIPEHLGKKSQRNAELERRRDVMACRYYYYAVVKRQLYEDCLMDLYREFFITPNTIVNELMKREEKISELIELKTPPSDLKKVYPWFNWS